VKKIYYDDSNKQEARQATIIDAWRGLTNTASIPRGRQYWTLCGLLGTSRVEPGSELDQVVKAGLIEPQQYHGVERDPLIHEWNQKSVAQTYPTASLYAGEIQRVLDQELLRGRLNPAIVNLDTEQQPEAAVNLLGSVLDILNQTKGRLLLVLNVVIEQKHWTVDYNESVVWEESKRNHYCHRRLLDGNWYRVEKPYSYQGSKKRTGMCTQIFVRGAP
jgi:hypothetical protein